MAQGVDESFLADLANHFRLPDLDYRTYSSLDLAYIGDAVFELIIRTTVMAKGGTSVNRMHKQTSALVNAPPRSQRIIRLDQRASLPSRKSGLSPAAGTDGSASRRQESDTLDKIAAPRAFEALMGYPLTMEGRFLPDDVSGSSRGVIRLLRREEAGKNRCE